jgi:hypothetical protein
MGLQREEDKEDWKVTQNGVTYTRKQICVILDRTFRCGNSTQGSPLEYYGPIPKLVRPPRRKRPN